MEQRSSKTAKADNRTLVRDVMTSEPIQLNSMETVAEAARVMKNSEIGAVLVTDEGSLCGMVTDRDIVVRGVADGRNLNQLKVGDICSRELSSLSPDDPLAYAVQMMRIRSVRRLPVVEDGVKPVGILSLGDLALRLDPSSVLGDISAAQPNR
jgi:CBS domain-containing protein